MAAPNSSKPLPQMAFEKFRGDRYVAQGKPIDVANDFPIIRHRSRMLITMLQVLDSNTVPEDMIDHRNFGNTDHFHMRGYSEVAAKWGEDGRRQRHIYGKESRFSGAPAALRYMSRSLGMVGSLHGVVLVREGLQGERYRRLQ